MSRFDLNKSEAKVRFVLEKRAVRTIKPLRVGLALDVSTSMKHLYGNGVVQETVNRTMAVACQFDSNKELDCWSFNTGFTRLKTATAADFETYVDKEIINNARTDKWGGTAYAPVMNDLVEQYFKEKARPGFLGRLFSGGTTAPSAQEPSLCLFLTDGANDDPAQTRRVLESAKRFPLYWQMVGVGNPKEFAFIEEVAEEYPNVGFVNLSRLDISDDELYEQILSNELCQWLKAQ